MNKREKTPVKLGSYLLVSGDGGGGLVRVEESLEGLLARSVLLGLLGLGGLLLLDDLGELGGLVSQLLGESAGRGGGGVQLVDDSASGSLLGGRLGGSDDGLDLVRVDDGGQIGVGHLRSEQSVSALEGGGRLVGSEDGGQLVDG